MADAGEGVALTGKRVLIIEDESLITMLFEDILAELGCDIAGSAPNLRQAMALARSTDADVAILDLNLAGEASFPAAEILRARRIPMILSSGYGSAGLPAEWQDLPILPKPFTGDQLATVLKGALSASA